MRKLVLDSALHYPLKPYPPPNILTFISFLKTLKSTFDCVSHAKKVNILINIKDLYLIRLRIHTLPTKVNISIVIANHNIFLRGCGEGVAHHRQFEEFSKIESFHRFHRRVPSVTIPHYKESGDMF